MSDEQRRRELRRLSVQLVAQLPVDPEEARSVIEFMRRLLDDFLTGREDGGARL
jgi:hypothetical protein